MYSTSNLFTTDETFCIHEQVFERTVEWRTEVTRDDKSSNCSLVKPDRL